MGAKIAPSLADQPQLPLHGPDGAAHLRQRCELGVRVTFQLAERDPAISNVR